MAALSEEIFSRGFRFKPSPQDAVTYYLPRLIDGTPLHEAVRPVIHHADVYACEPGVLARHFRPLPRTGDRFFFTTSKEGGRAAGPGSWYSQGATTDIVDRAQVKVGEVKRFRYKKGRVFTDWLMEEYSSCLQKAIVGDRQRVFCKIYVSPRADPDSAARQESASFVAHHAPAPVVTTQPRPEPPCPKRMRGAVAPTPPAVRPRPEPPVVTTQPRPEPPCPKRMRGSVAPTPPAVQPAGCTTSIAPPRPCVPNRVMAPASEFMARPPASSAQPPAPVPTRPAVQPGCSPAPAPPWPCAPPKQQTTPSVVRACHTPQQAPVRHCWPQPSVQTPPVAPPACSPLRFRDPFEVTTPTDDEAEDETAAAPDPPSMEATAAAQDDADDLAKIIEDALANSEGPTTAEADDDLEQFACSLEEELASSGAQGKERDPFAVALSWKQDLMLF